MSHSLDWRCPSCERPTDQELEGADVLQCRHCGHRESLASAARADDEGVRDPVEVCVACGGKRLYSQKDFNRRLGVAVVVVGAVLSPWTYGASLVVCMAFDYGLYFLVPEITVCYACDAIHRGFEHNPSHRAHDPLLAERFRKEARAEAGLEDAAETET